MEGVVKEVNQCLYTAIAEAIALMQQKKKSCRKQRPLPLWRISHDDVLKDGYLLVA